MRKTKIICTLGPATDDKQVLRELIEAGMNVARLNFSHGSHEEHKRRADFIKELRDELQVPLALMIDTKGPDIRVGRFDDNFVELNTGDEFILSTAQGSGNRTRVSVTYPELHRKLNPGDTVMLDDGLIGLEVTRIDGHDIHCVVLHGGIISNNKSVNVPGVKLDIPYIRDKDIDDIHFAIDNGFEFIAASFVRSAQDVLLIRNILTQRNAQHIKIIAKIENSEGVENIDEILTVSDSIMIARGDMGVELPLADLPAIQKLLIKKAMAAGRTSITATQMLESMIGHPRPTRAETSDVANAIYDGTSAIMLSGETSVGRYPVAAVRTMATIAEVTERNIDYKKRFRQIDWHTMDTSKISDAISHAVCSAAYHLDAAAILALTKGGNTSRMISRYRPQTGVIALTPDKTVYHQLSLSWGSVPLIIDHIDDDTEALFAHAIDIALGAGFIQSGDIVVLSAGIPLGDTGSTNMMRIAVAAEQ